MATPGRPVMMLRPRYLAFFFAAVLLIMTPFSQELEPPAFRGWFTCLLSGLAVFDSLTILIIKSKTEILRTILAKPII
jgi:hypothetical protein